MKTEAMKIQNPKILQLLLYLTVFMPYIELIPLGTDTQPYAFAVSLFVLAIFPLFKNEKIPLKIVPLLIFSFFALEIALLDGFSYWALRSLFGYISVSVIAYATYVIMNRNQGINSKIVKLIISIWAIVGLIQVFISPRFMQEFLVSMRTSAERGVTSLAPEPTFYGTMMCFLALTVVLFFKDSQSKNEKIFWVGLCFVQVFLIAKSAMIAVILGVTLSIYITEKLVAKWSLQKCLYGLFMISILIGSLIYLMNSQSNLRIVVSIREIIKNPIMFFFNDASANDRLSAIFFSFKGAFENYLLPNGFLEWPNYIFEAKQASKFFWWGGAALRIMSMYGAVFYELGILGMILPFTINTWLYKYLKNSSLSSCKYTILALINFLFVTAIPLATPFIGFLLGALLYYLNYASEEKQKQVSNVDNEPGEFSKAIAF